VTPSDGASPRTAGSTATPHQPRHGTPHHEGASLADHSRKQRAGHLTESAKGSLKSTNARESLAFWKSKGYSDAAIAGLLAQEASESDFKTHNVGDSGKAQGSFQWHADRRALIKGGTGVDVYSQSTLHKQMLEAADWELHHSENAAGKKILGAKTAYEAGYAGSRFYERAGGKHGAEQEAQRRGQLAETLHHGGQKGLLSDKPSSPASDGATPPAGTSQDISASSTYTHKGERITPEGFVVHHTGGRGTPQGVLNTLNQRPLGVQYVMDRSGRIYSTLPEGTRGAHLLPATNGAGLSNQNALGMEIIAKDASDVTDVQKKAAAEFIREKAKQYNFPTSHVYGHGEVNPGHKEADEGLDVAKMVRGGQ
jgi:Phage tail lysozyme/N-acetylmuramoyl-L-alanine amidase